jgi:hypothetical protein
MELLGTELEPDWTVHAGNYREGVTVSDRAGLVSNVLVAASEELDRARQNAPTPECRFHYRHTAAALAWEAAKLMPYDSGERTRVLRQAGFWLRSCDPDAAIAFCKAAAALGWEAAQHLPDNSDQTARVLCDAGSLIKNYDPQAADVFYKALVRRCRKTAIGAEADRIRWFPQLDEQGNLVPRKPPESLPRPEDETNLP